MQPESRMWQTYLGLSAEVRQTVSSALPAGPALDIYDDVRPGPIREAHNQWRVVDSALTDVETTVHNLGATIFDVWIRNPELTTEAKDGRHTVAVAEARAAIDERVALIKRQSDQISTTLRKAGFPARPQPQDAAQEAAIAGHKADLRMVLDSLEDADEVISEIGNRLSSALADGERLIVWILGSSRWPYDYLESRRFGPRSDPRNLDAEIATALDRFGAKDLVEVRRAYAQTKRQRALPALSAMLGAALAAALRDYEAWRPYSTTGNNASFSAGAR